MTTEPASVPDMPSLPIPSHLSSPMHYFSSVLLIRIYPTSFLPVSTPSHAPPSPLRPLVNLSLSELIPSLDLGRAAALDLSPPSAPSSSESPPFPRSLTASNPMDHSDAQSNQTPPLLAFPPSVQFVKDRGPHLSFLTPFSSMQ
ncbi:hypothetical protein AMTR_s00072p00194350, partial [Amborella trichopoda]